MSFGWFLALPSAFIFVIQPYSFLIALLYVRLPILHYQTRLGLLQRS